MGSVLGESYILLVVDRNIAHFGRVGRGPSSRIFSGAIRFPQTPIQEVEQYDMGPIQHPCHIQFIRAYTSHLLERIDMRSSSHSLRCQLALNPFDDDLYHLIRVLAKYVVGPVDNDLLDSMRRTCNDIGGISWRDDIIFATVHQ